MGESPPYPNILVLTVFFSSFPSSCRWDFHWQRLISKLGVGGWEIGRQKGGMSDKGFPKNLGVPNFEHLFQFSPLTRPLLSFPGTGSGTTQPSASPSPLSSCSILLPWSLLLKVTNICLMVVPTSSGRLLDEWTMLVSVQE